MGHLATESRSFLRRLKFEIDKTCVCPICGDFKTTRADWNLYKGNIGVLDVKVLFHMLYHVREAHEGSLVFKFKQSVCSQSEAATYSKDPLDGT